MAGSRSTHEHYYHLVAKDHRGLGQAWGECFGETLREEIAEQAEQHAAVTRWARAKERDAAARRILASRSTTLQQALGIDEEASNDEIARSKWFQRCSTLAPAMLELATDRPGDSKVFIGVDWACQQQKYRR